MGIAFGNLTIFRMPVNRTNPNRFPSCILSNTPSIIGIDVDFNASYASPPRLYEFAKQMKCLSISRNTLRVQF